MSVKFYRCNICGNLVVKAIDSGINIVCCGEEMEELIPHTADNGMEKHVPVINQIGENLYQVKVGSTEHPMLPTHYIQFIYLETEHGGQIAYLSPNCSPMATFYTKEKIIAAYEYCNIHGLWKVQL